MSEVTRILNEVQQGHRHSAEQLLPLVYEELRILAAQRMVQENPGQTLQATALVHEAYLRLVESDQSQSWESRGHFFAAAAEAMRRIIIDEARRKQTQRRGGDRKRFDLERVEVAFPKPSPDMLALDEVLEQFETIDPIKSKLVKLRYFVGLTNSEAAQVLGISSTTADRYWAFARAWLYAKLNRESSNESD